MACVIIGFEIWHMDCISFPLQIDCMDFEAMHKWAVKQFMRLVPHGRHMTSHLTARHFAQFLFTKPPESDDEPNLLYCHCDEDPCPHDLHVHASMPGLRDESSEGLYTPGDKRSVTRWPVVLSEEGGMDENVMRALRGFVGRVNGEEWSECDVPDVLWQANTMELSWHDRDGKLQVRELLHASEDYYDGGKWYDTVLARHTVPRRGGARRRPQERSRAELNRRAMGRGDPAADEEEVEDVAMIVGLYFCQIPSGKHVGEWHPMIAVFWHQYFNAFAEMQIEDGDHAGMARCQALLQELGVETVKEDPHETIYFLEISDVSSMVYLQNGYSTPKSGKPDWMWIDTMWDKM